MSVNYKQLLETSYTQVSTRLEEMQRFFAITRTFALKTNGHLKILTNLVNDLTDSDDTIETEVADPRDVELAQAKAALLQLAADFENFKRLTARRESEARDRAVRSISEDLLPVLDNFERAVEAARTATDVASVRMGVEFILQMLSDSLKSHGVTVIAALGQPFDPIQHEAVEEIEIEGETAGTVVEETLRGYEFKGQVLRASRVKVAS